ncbi:putative transmembrane protein [Cupriavidus basilensis]|uniref:Putative transmembrane protein n=2 Tax=Cupriavidus basilensis TaxID=68895 RepID=A0A0C4Y5R4_9BURK|nr:putative transmembrane protein [Cupriavidus basilensis]
MYHVMIYLRTGFPEHDAKAIQVRHCAHSPAQPKEKRPMPPSQAPSLADFPPARARAWLRAFAPTPIAAGRRERVKSCLGALVGLLLTEWISRHLLGGFNPWFIAPMGASAVLLFAVPASPLAQPWSIIGGNLVAALIGVACARWIPEPGLAASVAVALAIVAMFQLRCVHPPSGAVAITAVFGGHAVTQLGFGFVVMPVAVNSMLLLLVALLFNNLMRRRYPHRPVEHANPHRTADPLPSERVGFNRSDLDEVLKARGEFLDIEEDDLEDILVAAQLRAYRRHFGDVRCVDIMSRDVVTVQPGQSALEARALLFKHGIQALPVVDAQRRLLGMLGLADLLAARNGAEGQVRAGTAKDLMHTSMATARAEQPMVELARAFSNGGLHQVPVVDAQRRLLGIVTQSDLIAALLEQGPPPKVEPTAQPAG